MAAASASATCPIETGRAALAAARGEEQAARAHQSAAAARAAHDGLARRPRAGLNQRSDIAGWEARASDAARRLSYMEQRFEEIAEERAWSPPARALMRGSRAARAMRGGSGRPPPAEAGVAAAGEDARAAEAALAGAGEALSTARERAPAGRARRTRKPPRDEMARISGERFQCPPRCCRRFAFEPGQVAHAGEESAAMDCSSPTASGSASQPRRRRRARPARAGARRQRRRAGRTAEAVHRLRGSIGNLNREAASACGAAFEQVDEHFRHLFTACSRAARRCRADRFGRPARGRARDLRPAAGRRLQSLTLLSGGEQALTAVALIFALFLTNPAPICVLDEVDAPLDDANIERFCDLLDAMVSETDTRYLIVTHNAVTMSRMHRLFGVTMVERVISRLVSGDLGGAEELLAAENPGSFGKLRTIQDREVSFSIEAHWATKGVECPVGTLAGASPGLPRPPVLSLTMGRYVPCARPFLLPGLAEPHTALARLRSSGGRRPPPHRGSGMRSRSLISVSRRAGSPNDQCPRRARGRLQHACAWEVAVLRAR
jgi:chromosome segregation protein